jgi:hypothetical protein
MTITLNHTVVPARDKVAAARFFARIFDLSFDGSSDHFAPVRVNETLTLLFDEDTSYPLHNGLNRKLGLAQCSETAGVVV